MKRTIPLTVLLHMQKQEIQKINLLKRRHNAVAKNSKGISQ